MATIREQIASLEEEILKTQKNKASLALVEVQNHVYGSARNRLT